MEKRGEMTFDELKLRKRFLERKLLKEIRRFELICGFKVTGILIEENNLKVLLNTGTKRNLKKNGGSIIINKKEKI